MLFFHSFIKTSQDSATTAMTVNNRDASEFPVCDPDSYFCPCFSCRCKVVYMVQNSWKIFGNFFLLLLFFHTYKVKVSSRLLNVSVLS